ncbi:MAG TPA: transposase [Hymenobacter sp.]|uniref:REP-associated tyrosine transposase n=1 Tax=Hymenobacter sp. TaxID=1898978 RepID=UPI002D7E5A0F|nr:transposase [Hymenobacter sp.]HET9503756.1 transposase [Hymenobacter sp.]
MRDSLHFYAGKAYQLDCYCIMPNHVHVLLMLPDDALPLTQTLQSIKSFTAKKANKLLGRTGAFWHRETYDHLCRDADEVQRIISYILLNPVKAGLVAEWQHWPHTYLP